MVLVHRRHELGGLLGTDGVFDGDEYRPILEGRTDVTDERRHPPVVPRAHVRGRVRHPPCQSERRRDGGAEAGVEKSRLDSRAFSDRAPEGAAGGETALEHEHEHREHARSHPVGREALNQGRDQRDEDDPGASSDEQHHPEGGHRARVAGHDDGDAEDGDGGGRHDLVRPASACGLHDQRPADRARPKQPRRNP